MEVHFPCNFPALPWMCTSLSIILYLHWSHGRREVPSLWSLISRNHYLHAGYVETQWAIDYIIFTMTMMKTMISWSFVYIFGNFQMFHSLCCELNVSVELRNERWTKGSWLFSRFIRLMNKKELQTDLELLIRTTLNNKVNKRSW